MRTRLECQVFGRVQMVMFRDFVARKARARNIVGTVKNNPDGSVLVIAEGEEAKLKELLAHIHSGSIFSRVDRVEASWNQCLGEFKTFDILY